MTLACKIQKRIGFRLITLIFHSHTLEHDWTSLSEYIIIYPSGEFYMSWLVASDQLRQLSLLWRRHKVKDGLHCTDEAQHKAETYVCSYLAPYKNPPFHILERTKYCVEV